MSDIDRIKFKLLDLPRPIIFDEYQFSCYFGDEPDPEFEIWFTSGDYYEASKLGFSVGLTEFGIVLFPWDLQYVGKLDGFGLYYFTDSDS